MREAAAFGILLGACFYLVDMREAWVVRKAVGEAARAVRLRDGNARVWYLGHWGFAYYAEREGMSPLVPDHTRLRRGDRVLIPDRIGKPAVRVPPGARTSREFVLEYDDPVHLKTVPAYYDGSTPFEHRDGPRFRLAAYRCLTDFTPVTSWGARTLAHWVRRRSHLRGAARALPRLKADCRARSPEVRRQAAETIGRLGPRGRGAMEELRSLLRDPDERVRGSARRSLRFVGGSR